ncbi:hypothetical protein DL93DRAFT_199609 [Clavulina sp. PMI_390]|nr:hypothetical protein DL93DRAFT_199609 [Clavulina sp. PMI_390]
MSSHALPLILEWTVPYIDDSDDLKAVMLSSQLSWTIARSQLFRSLRKINPFDSDLLDDLFETITSSKWSFKHCVHSISFELKDDDVLSDEDGSYIHNSNAINDALRRMVSAIDIFTNMRRIYISITSYCNTDIDIDISGVVSAISRAPHRRELEIDIDAPWDFLEETPELWAQAAKGLSCLRIRYAEELGSQSILEIVRGCSQTVTNLSLPALFLQTYPELPFDLPNLASFALFENIKSP